MLTGGIREGFLEEATYKRHLREGAGVNLQKGLYLQRLRAPEAKNGLTHFWWGDAFFSPVVRCTIWMQGHG